MKKPVKTSKKPARRFRRLSITALIVAAAMLAIGAVTVLSRQRAESKNKATQAAAKPEGNFVKVRVAGQDVWVDSQTGRMKPLTEEEKQQLAAGLRGLINQSTEGLTPVRQPDGSLSVEMPGRFENVTVARENTDGTFSEACVDNAQAAGEFFGIDPRQIDNSSAGSRSVRKAASVTPANPNQ
ncbi:MAG TPA: hypothetical protein VGW36_04845 [Pyrinomonadaceae bacterium]|nr:hypothetical protein [Pyrinomonadaceae bacterium]